MYQIPVNKGSVNVPMLLSFNISLFIDNTKEQMPIALVSLIHKYENWHEVI